MIPAVQRWPDDLAARYRSLGLWKGETMSEWLRGRAASFGERIAIVGGLARWSYRELDERADLLAGGLLASGVAPGDRVIVQLPNGPEFAAVMFGLVRAGAVPVFALPAHRRVELEHFARAAEARAIVVTAGGPFDYVTLAEGVAAVVPTVRHVFVAGDDSDRHVSLGRLLEAGRHGRALPALAASDVALMQISGGSTGLSKLIPRTHDDYLYSVRASAEICGLTTESVYLCVLPMAHNFPMSSPGFLGTLHAGGTVVLSPSPAPDVAFALIARERVTITALVPPLAVAWLDAVESLSPDLSSLETVQVGGAKLTPEVARRVGPGFGVTLQQVFGMAEGLVNYTRLDDPDAVITGTQGRPISSEDELLVVDDDGRPVPAGRVGQLLTRGPYTIRGYHNAPEANARSFTADGFYRTGDLVQQTAEGNVVVTGRVSDQINRGGEKVSGEEVEDHLVAHPSVRDAVVVSVPDPYLGERSCAFVLSREPRLRPTALKAWIRERGLASFKVPDQILFVDEFPTTAVGKTSRQELRNELRRTWQRTQPFSDVDTP